MTACRDLVREFEVAVNGLHSKQDALHRAHEVVETTNKEIKQLIDELMQDGYVMHNGKWVRNGQELAGEFRYEVGDKVD